MATYPKQVWDQLKNKTKGKIIAALERDGWALDETVGKQRVYLKEFPEEEPPNRRVVIHYHPNETYRNPGLLKNVLSEIGWSVQDMRRLKLVK